MATARYRNRRLVLMAVLAVMAVLALALMSMVAVLRVVTRSDRRTSPGEMLRLTREWARLAPLPEPNTGFTIVETGNLFTRGFEMKFVADESAIEQWLKDSPGTRSSKAEPGTGNVRVFTIVPGGGAQTASVLVDDRIHQVRIAVAWS